MKKIFLLAVCTVIISVSYAQKLTPDEAAKRIGDTVTVCGKIYGGKFFDKNKLTLLNMGAAYPKSPLTIVIYGENRDKFKNAPEVFYSNKNVCIKGLVQEFKGKPQIIIKKENEIITE
ncbi:MAG: hypothetical protein AMXMBFR79_03640 [Chitinophagaceae bacterium]|nr:hypothetical protein [Chitinophagaceae bacterium]MCZ2298672.1 hypothetical protein [Chitinophagales bacterium]